MLRELGEEVGVTGRTRPRLFHAYSNFTEYKSDHVVVFSLREFEIVARENREIAEFGFFDPALPPETTSPATLRRLAEWREGRASADLW